MSHYRNVLLGDVWIVQQIEFLQAIGMQDNFLHSKSEHREKLE
jgi:hypothetical protein